MQISLKRQIEALMIMGGHSMEDVVNAVNDLAREEAAGRIAEAQEIQAVRPGLAAAIARTATQLLTFHTGTMRRRG